MDYRLPRQSLFAAAVVVAVLGAAGSLTGDTRHILGNGDGWTNALVAIGQATLGWFLTGRRPRLVVGWLLLSGGAISAVSLASTWWARQTLIADPGSLPFGSFAAWLEVWVSPLSFPLVLIAPLVLFPAGVPRSRRSRWGFGLLAAVIGVQCAIAAIAGGFASRSDPVGLLDIPGIAEGSAAHLAVGAGAAARLLGFVGTLAALIALVGARRGTKGVERRMYDSVLIGAAATMVVVVLAGLVAPLTGQRHQAPEGVFGLAILAIPLAACFAIVRYGLYDLRVAINRTLLVATSGAVLAGLYFVVLFAIARLVGDTAQISVQGVLASGVVVLATRPVVARLVLIMHRRFGRTTGASAVANRFSRDESDVDAAASLDTLAGIIRDEVRLGSVAIDVRGLAQCSTGEPDGDLVRLPLRHGMALIGEVAVTARRGESLGAADLRTLTEITRYVEVAARSMQVGEDLMRSRLALEEAQSNERRRLRRDLHDGIGPTLASIRLRLGSARRRLPKHLAEELAVDEIDAAVAEVIHEVRRIVEGLQPSVLEDVGLVPALEILINEQRRASGISITFDASSVTAPVAERSMHAAYRATAEAIANVVRHSRATIAKVHAVVTDSKLVIEISDNGIGFDTADRSGVGLRSMTERVAASGGQVNIASVQGHGTTIKLELPT